MLQRYEGLFRMASLKLLSCCVCAHRDHQWPEPRKKNFLLLLSLMVTCGACTSAHTSLTRAA